MLLVVDGRWADVVCKVVGAWKTEPRSVESGKTAESVVLAHNAPTHQKVEVPESPGNETKTCHAEEAVQDLGIDLDPYLASRGEVVTRRMAHGRCGVEEDKEDHGAPGDDIQAVDCDEEAKRRYEEFPKCAETYDGRLLPGVLFGKAVAVGVSACLIWPDFVRFGRFVC